MHFTSYIQALWFGEFNMFSGIIKVQTLSHLR